MKRLNKNIIIFALIMIFCLFVYKVGTDILRTYVDFSLFMVPEKIAGNYYARYPIYWDCENLYPTDEDPTTYKSIWRTVHEQYKNENPNKSINKYFNAKEWIIIKNIPENPPANLIVLATRNIDPSTLRTHLTDDDMQKTIRFFSWNYLSPLAYYAVLIRADHRTILIQKSRPKSMTYQKIYSECLFNVVTNSTTGFTVKYLLPDGKEVIPTNE